jgi:hypothetical protein
MAIRRQASFNPTLTNYAQGYAQDLASALAAFVAPVVRVPAAVGQYKAFDEKNAFQAHDTGRALGGQARRIEFAAADPTYNCQPQALEIAIDDAERDAAGEQAQALEEGKVRTLISAAVISHEDKTVSVMKTLSAVGSKGQWSNTSNDPVAEIDEQIEAIAAATGMMPNAIVFGLGAWRVFRSHPKVAARQPGAAIIGVTEQQAATMMLNPAIQVRVGVLSKDTTKFGATASKTNIIGAEVFIFARSSSPTVYDPGWMKTFSAGEGSVTAVRQYRDESARSDVLAIDWSEDIRISSAIAARRLTIS